VCKKTLWSALLLTVSLTFTTTAAARTDAGGERNAPFTIKIAHVGITGLNEGPAYLLTGAPVIFRRHGLVAKWTTFNGSSPNCTAALLSGSIDLCVVGAATPINAMAQGANLRIVAGSSNYAGNLVLSKQTLAKLSVTQRSPLVARLNALKGLTIATSAVGTTWPTILSFILRTAKAGIDIGDIKMVTLTDPVAMQEGMRNGKYDAAMWGSGALEPALFEGVAVRWVSLPKDAPQTREVPLHVVFTRDDYANAHPLQMRQLNAAFAEAGKWADKKPVGAKAIIRKTYFADMDERVYETGSNDSFPSWNRTAKITRTMFNNLLMIQKIGNPTRNFDSITYTRLVDPAARG
jgi:ABC-type nitrate/sulfonate/bicarbonate transport system substrate-binding protein